MKVDCSRKVCVGGLLNLNTDSESQHLRHHLKTYFSKNFENVYLVHQIFVKIPCGPWMDRGPLTAAAPPTKPNVFDVFSSCPACIVMIRL